MKALLKALKDIILLTPLSFIIVPIAVLTIIFHLLGRLFTYLTTHPFHKALGILLLLWRRISGVNLPDVDEIIENMRNKDGTED